MHLNSCLLFEKYALEHFRKGDVVLEIGPDIIPSTLQQMVKQPDLKWHTLNLEVGEITSRARNSDLTIITQHEYTYPIADNTYDVIVSANVLEHVKKFWLWFDELKRILKPGGLIITVAPISWPYHEAPVDCWRIYPDGIRALYDDKKLIDVFTTFECLEKELYRDHINTPIFPWATTVNSRKVQAIKYYNTLLKVVPFSKFFRIPLPVSYDLITIARKPLEEQHN